jgi:hypothetical protein
VLIKPERGLLDSERYREEHDRGEILVAAMLQSFLAVLRHRLSTLGRSGIICAR